MQAFYKVTITDSNYESTKYTAWVSASSKTQAIVKGAALAGQEKYRREAERTGREPGVEGLLEPRLQVEKVGASDYWDHQEEVVVTP